MLRRVRFISFSCEKVREQCACGDPDTLICVNCEALATLRYH
jgi:hypothetical protein